VIHNPHDYQSYFTNPQVVGKYNFYNEYIIYSKKNSPVKSRKTGIAVDKLEGMYENVII
jgi:hypothetical protein